MSLFERISDQVHSIELRLNSLRRELDHARLSAAALDAALGEVDSSAKELTRCISHLNLFHEILMQLDCDGLTLKEAIARALQSIWQKVPLSYAVLILGEAELGPYYYQEMHGVEKPWEYLGKECPFPLSGVLAQTLLRKSDPTAPDHLCINDIRAQKRPTVDEFPWMPRHGSMLILPLRLNNYSLAKGVLVVGRSVQDGFADAQMRHEFEDVAKNLAHLIYYAQMRHELTRQTEQLVNVQLATREIARAQSVDDVLQILTRKIGEVISDVDVEVYLRSVEAIYDSHIDPNEPELYLYENNSYLEQPLSGQLRQMFAWTMRVGEPVFYYPTRLDAEPEHAYYSISGPAMVVPIVGKEYTFGVIQVLARNEARLLDETDTLVMRSIANTVAVALKSVDLDLGKTQSQISSLQTLITLAEEQTGLFVGHSQRVAHNASLIARRVGVDDKMWSQIRAAAALHNVSILISPLAGRNRGAMESLDNVQHQTALSSSLLRQMRFEPAIIHLVEMAAHPYGLHEMLTPSEVHVLSEHAHYFTNDAFFRNGADSTERAYSATYAINTHRNPSRLNQLFVFQNSAQLGAQIIQLADAFDTWLCSATNRQIYSLETQLQYLDSQAGVTHEPHLIALLQSLLKEEQIALPKRAQKQPVLLRV
ncbi:MAG: hypothetical protein R2911_13315 [Caldilineaceae bacterium]